jgi:hypothetical protein
MRQQHRGLRKSLLIKSPDKHNQGPLVVQPQRLAAAQASESTVHTLCWLKRSRLKQGDDAICEQTQAPHKHSLNRRPCNAIQAVSRTSRPVLTHSVKHARRWSPGFTTLECALKFCCSRGICPEAPKGYPRNSVACTVVVAEIAHRAMWFCHADGKPLPVAGVRTHPMHSCSGCTDAQMLTWGACVCSPDKHTRLSAQIPKRRASTVAAAAMSFSSCTVLLLLLLLRLVTLFTLLASSSFSSLVTLPTLPTPTPPAAASEEARQLAGLHSFQSPSPVVLCGRPAAGGALAGACMALGVTGSETVLRGGV